MSPLRRQALVYISWLWTHSEPWLGLYGWDLQSNILPETLVGLMFEYITEVNWGPSFRVQHKLHRYLLNTCLPSGDFAQQHRLRCQFSGLNNIMLIICYVICIWCVGFLGYFDRNSKFIYHWQVEILLILCLNVKEKKKFTYILVLIKKFNKYSISPHFPLKFF